MDNAVVAILGAKGQQAAVPKHAVLVGLEVAPVKSNNLEHCISAFDTRSRGHLVQPCGRNGDAHLSSFLCITCDVNDEKLSFSWGRLKVAMYALNTPEVRPLRPATNKSCRGKRAKSSEAIPT